MSTPDTRRPVAAGRLTASLAALMVATLVSLVVPTTPAAATASTTDYIANCSVDLMTSPVAVAAGSYSAAALVTTIKAGTGVTANTAVDGDAWSETCDSTTVTGTTWLPIVAQGETPVGTLYPGDSVLYAPAGEFRVSPGYLEGIDVSRWQGTIDWPTVASAGGKQFAFIKATEGTTYVNANYASDHAHARAVGIRTSAYHFAQPSASTADGVAQADWFVANMGLTSGDLFPALDLEVRNSLTNSQLITWVQAFMGELYARTGMKGAIYVSPSFWSSYMNNTTWFAANGYTVLWIAHWFVKAPTVPASNWAGRGWTFWQYSNCGHVPGIGGGTSCVDLDRYNGTDLTRMTFAPDFSVAVPSSTSQSPTATGGSTSSTKASSAASVPQGSAAGYAISISRMYFTLPISFDVSGLPAGAAASWSASPASSGTTNLTIATSQGGVITPPGTYPLTITGSATLNNGITGVGALISRTATATLTVVAPNYTITAPTVSIKQGATASMGVSVARSYVDSAIGLSVSGLPAGTAATFTPAPIGVGGTGGFLTIVTTLNGSTPTGQFPAAATDPATGTTSGGPTAGPTPVGRYTLTIHSAGTAPAGAGGAEIDHTMTVTLTVIDGIAPVASGPTSRLYSGTTVSTTATPVWTTWSASDPSGIRAYTVQRQVDGGSWSTVTLPSATSTGITQLETFGHRYRYRVLATDGAGNVGPWSYGPTMTPTLFQQTSSAFSYGASWYTAWSTSYLGGSERYTRARGATATFKVWGSSFAWVGYKGPNRGYAAIYVDGAYRGTVNLYASSYQARRVIWTTTFASNGSHAIRIVNLATSGHPRIDLDAGVRLVFS